MGKRAEAEAKFRAVVASNGGAIIGQYMGSASKVRLRCSHGHEWEVVPNRVANLGTWCPTCANKARGDALRGAFSSEAETKFRAVVVSKGGEVVGKYAGSLTKVRLRCGHGHEWETRPNSIRNGSWCPTCAGRKSPTRSPEEAEARFRAAVTEKGGEVLGDYANWVTKVRLRCAHGHEWEARPDSIVSRGTWCPVCAGKSPEAAEARFRAAVAEKGGEIIGEYAGTMTKVRLRCSKGHEWEATPNSIVCQGSWCPTCAGKSPEAAEAKFRTVVSEKGGEVVGDYVDTITKVRLRCAEGHEWDVAPSSVTSMGSWCPTCACGIRSDKVRGKTRKKRSKAEAEAAFREIVVAKGGKVVGKYVNMLTKVRLRCAEGHEWEAKPATIVHNGTWCPTCVSSNAEAKFRAAVASKEGTVIGEYAGTLAKVRLRCRHGHDWDAMPNKVTSNGTWCPTCVNKGRKRVHRGTSSKAEVKFRAVVASKGGEVLGAYVNTHTKVRLRCGHGHEWDALPNNVVSSKGTWCPTCAEANKRPPRITGAVEAHFRSVVAAKGGDVLGFYTTAKAKVRLRCRHGHEWLAPPNSILYGTWCPVCAGVSPEVAEAQFRSVVAEKGGEVIGEYAGTLTKVHLRCAEGHEWDAKPHSVVHKGTWCPICAQETKQVAEAKFRSVVSVNGGAVLGAYTNSQTKVRLRCSQGHEWEAKPNNIVHGGTWCPTCAREAHGAKIMGGKKGTEVAPVPASASASNMPLAALVLAMSRVGIDRIEEGNSRQAASRIAIWQKIAGPVVLDGRKVVIGAEDVERNVGLVLPGVETLTAEGFERRLGELVAGA